METGRSFDGAEPETEPGLETGTMADPRSESRGLVIGLLIATIFWCAVAAFAWWLLS